MISYIFWNIKKEIFVIPFLNIPIVWYSLFFLTGFIIGYYNFKSLLKRYFSLFPKIDQKDIVDHDALLTQLIMPKNSVQKEIASLVDEKINANSAIKDTLFSINNFIANKIQLRLFFENGFEKCILTFKKKADLITDKLLVYMMIATVIGARLGHVFLYEDQVFYLKHPLEILKVWQGGLASHGAAFAIIIAMVLFSRHLTKYSPKISFIKLMDFIAVPIALAGFFIRIGNFFNQEILGKPTSFFTAIIFSNPQDSFGVVPRHPVQLYEAVFYLFVFVFLFLLSYKNWFLKKEGFSIGLFLILVFSFRFFIEFLKVKQSYILSDNSILLMGQYLSIPFVLIGIAFLFSKKIKSYLKAS